MSDCCVTRGLGVIPTQMSSLISSQHSSPSPLSPLEQRLPSSRNNSSLSWSSEQFSLFPPPWNNSLPSNNSLPLRGTVLSLFMEQFSPFDAILYLLEHLRQTWDISTSLGTSLAHLFWPWNMSSNLGACSPALEHVFLALHFYFQL